MLFNPKQITKSRPRVYLRADGNAQMGLGHISRCLALAEMLSDEFDCYFITKKTTQHIENEINSICNGLQEIPVSIDTLGKEAVWINEHLQIGEDVFILDGYHFDTDYQRAIKSSGAKLVCLDDMADKHYVADMIINHAGGWSPSDFSAEHDTEFCLGPAYAVLKMPFLNAAQITQNSTDATRKILVCFGGADPNNDTLKILKKLHKMGINDEIKVILGPAYLHHAAFEKYCATHAPHIEKLSKLQPSEMLDVMRECTTAILPPSTIAYEYLHVSGNLFLHQIADNQRYIKHFLIENDLAFSIDDFGKIPQIKLEFAKQQQRIIFDGKSNQRIAAAVKSLLHSQVLEAI